MKLWIMSQQLKDLYIKYVELVRISTQIID